MPPPLALTDVSLSVGSTQLVQHANAHVTRGQCVAVIGANGCGKSTLLRAVARAAAADDACEGSYFVVGAGSVSVCDGDRVLFVEQDSLRWLRLWPGAEHVFAEQDLLALPVAEALDLLIAEGIDAALEDAEAWRRLRIAADEALGWRFAAYSTTPISQLSPGCAVRAYIALAVQRPSIDLLLLDEPTNHMDLPTLMWLQHAIAASGKAVVLVSHDAAFMDQVCNALWVLDAHTHTLEVLATTYSEYQRAAEAARERQLAEYEAQQKRRARLGAAVEKLREASTKGSRYMTSDHAKLQRNHKRERAGRSGRNAKAMEAKLNAEVVVEKVMRHAPLRIEFDPFGAGADSSMIAEEIVLGHDAHAPLRIPAFSVRIDFGERVAIVGFNGVGKSTLLHTLLGEKEPIAGHARVGRELRIGNVTQEHSSLPRSETPRRFLSDALGASAFDAGAHLHRYGVKRAQTDRPIAHLNPGARVRVLLALFAARRVNALVLDEPNNHLDEEAVSELLASLNSFSGTVLVVSHSRSFLSQLSLTRTLRLSENGLDEVNLPAFMQEMESTAADVVHNCW